MLKVRQFRYGADNLGYVVWGPSTALVIDGGAAEAILAFLAREGLTLGYVANTHGHSDHTSGNARLLDASGAVLLKDLEKGGDIQLDGEPVEVIPTPGHTADSRCFYTGSALITGDTLFNGTVGNCFSGDLEGFFRSIKRLMAYPAETLVYAGHDYVRDSLAFARRLEPQNRAIEQCLRCYDPTNVVSTLAQERQMNPYLRFDEPAVMEILAKRGLPAASDWQRWQSLMSIE